MKRMVTYLLCTVMLLSTLAACNTNKAVVSPSPTANVTASPLPTATVQPTGAPEGTVSPALTMTPAP